MMDEVTMRLEETPLLVKFECNVLQSVNDNHDTFLNRFKRVVPAIGGILFILVFLGFIVWMAMP
ncbi:MAG: hypothetical protein LBQ26_00730 [Holosporales bacterium]|jgi:hypothetical protein|nr:hypothetical protein [Holosporales bacterium]